MHANIFAHVHCGFCGKIVAMKKKIVFIGNSIVAGYPWSRGKSFVSLFRKECKESPIDPNVGFEIINKGVNGDTTKGILSRLESDALSASSDMVFIMTGTNDFVYRDASPAEAFANLEEMARMCEEKGVLPIYITPIPVDAVKAESMWLVGMGISYAAVNRQLEEFSRLIRCSNRMFVDMNRYFGEYAQKIGDPDLTYLDGLHPMPDGHAFMAKCIREFFEENKEGLL